MPRPSKPWFREASNTWVATVRKKQYTLSRGRKNLAAANKKLRELIDRLEQEDSTGEDKSIREVCDRFLDRVQKKHTQDTYQWYLRHLQDFLGFVDAEMPSQELTPAKVESWVNSKQWSKTTERGALTAVSAAFNWARKQKVIADNPVRYMEKPEAEPRETVLSEEQINRLLNATTGGFKDLVTFLVQTGARPSEGMRLEAKFVDLATRTIVMPGKTTRKTRKKRLIYLNDAALAVVTRCMEQWPVGPIFRNEKGTGWNRQTTARKLQRLRTKLKFGPEVILEALRHTYVTNAVARGESGEKIAHLVGHKSTQMIARHYLHLDQRRPEMHAAVARLTHGGTEAHPTATENGSPES
jgi:site-specific recombinase XerD